MIRRNSSETERPIFTETVNEFVPASWKLWALIFRSIASGHYDELNLPLEVGSVPLVKDISFKSSIEQLYLETCCWVSSELPSGFRSLSFSDRLEVFHAIKEVARDIVDSYTEAKKVLPKECPEKEYFEIIKKNCDVILALADLEIGQIGDHEPSPKTENEIISILKNHDRELETRDWEAEQVLNHESPGKGHYFNPKKGVVECLKYTDEMGSHYYYVDSTGSQRWYYFDAEWVKCLHKKVNRVLIQNILLNKFEHVLNCDGEVCVSNPWDLHKKVPQYEDYSDEKIVPKEDFGMAMYVFILGLIHHRHEDEMYIDGDVEWHAEPWERFFRKRIDWRKKGYILEEDYSWKVTYASKDATPPKYNGDSEALKAMQDCCGRRVFGELYSKDNFESIISTDDSFSVGYEQYLYIHNRPDELKQVLRLLVAETDFFYRNLNDIAGLFVSLNHAKSIQETAQWRSEEKIKNNTFIHSIYTSFDQVHIETVQRLLFERAGLAHGHLGNQPIIYSELVKDYIKKVIIQNEGLKREIIRALYEQSFRLTNNIPAVGVFDQLRDEGLIDENNEIQKKNKNYKERELLRYLVDKEFVVPNPEDGGWEAYFKSYGNEKQPSIKIKGYICISDNDWKSCYDSNRLTDFFYNNYLPANISMLDNNLDWSQFNNKFHHPKHGRLTSEKLAHDFIDHGEDDRIKIYTKLLKKYEEKVNKQNSVAETTQCIEPNRRDK